jgi:hypothetical protein
MAISVTITGKHKIKQQAKYISKKIAPPPCPTSKGNFQMLPRPTAEPAAAKMKPILLLNPPLSAIHV